MRVMVWTSVSAALLATPRTKGRRNDSAMISATPKIVQIQIGERAAILPLVPLPPLWSSLAKAAMVCCGWEKRTKADCFFLLNE